MSTLGDTLPDDLETLKAALLAERAARREAEARASGAEAMVAHLKLLIAKLKRERFGPSSEHRRRLLDQLELQLEELEASATQDAAKEAAAVDADQRRSRGRVFQLQVEVGEQASAVGVTARPFLSRDRTSAAAWRNHRDQREWNGALVPRRGRPASFSDQL
ncbi:MAG: IS66 family transposase [Rhodospirillales bacterium]